MGMIDGLWRRGAEFLGVKYPIMSGGMTWISDADLVHAVANSGAFPVLAGGNMPPAEFEAALDECLERVKTPFAVNLITIAPHYKTHLEITASKPVPFVIFAGNFPRKSDVQIMKSSGKRTLAFASTESIAEQQIRYGNDGLILEGSEAGGHIGHVSLVILLQQVLFTMREFPIFVAGGLADGRMMAHLLMMGATGIQLGTRFVMSEECKAHPRFKSALKRARARQAIATPQYDSKLPVVAVRALKNRGMDNFGRLQLELLQKLSSGAISREAAQYEVEHFWMGSLRRAVMDGDVQEGSLMAGQSVGLIHDIKPLRTIIQDLIADAESELDRIGKIVRTIS